MRLNAAWRWFLAYTAAFAVLAGFVFWGTWSMDFAPVMPDSPIAYPPSWFADFWANWTAEGRFTPLDLTVFLGSPYFWQELKYVLGTFFAGLAIVYYLRGRGVSRLGSYSAGLLLPFSGYWLTLFSAGHLGWFMWMAYGLFPFGLADRAIRKGKAKNWLLLGATLGWACYWQTDLWLLFAAFSGIHFVYVCVRERRIPSWKGILLAALAFFAIGAAGIRKAFVQDLAGRESQIESGETLTAEQKSKADAAESRWIFVTNWSLPFSETAEFLLPRINGDTSCQLTLAIGNQNRTGVKPYVGAIGRPYGAERGNYRQHSVYVGFVTCLLALFAVATSFAKGRRSRDVWFFAGAAILFWLCSLGRYCEPVYRVIFALPFGDTMRCPVKWHHLTEFCLAVLAGFGVARLELLSGKFGRWGRFAVMAIVLVGAADLARVAKLYCAPVPIGEARRQRRSFEFTGLPYSAFSNPQVAQAVKTRQIVPVAHVANNPATPKDDFYLVGLLKPWGERAKAVPFGAPAWLGILSAVAGLSVSAYAIRKALGLTK